MAEGRQLGGGNVAMKFGRNWSGNTFQVSLLPHLDITVIFPNWSDCQFSSNQAPVAHQVVDAMLQAFVSVNVGYGSDYSPPNMTL